MVGTLHTYKSPPVKFFEQGGIGCQVFETIAKALSIRYRMTKTHVVRSPETA